MNWDCFHPKECTRVRFKHPGLMIGQYLDVLVYPWTDIHYGIYIRNSIDHVGLRYIPMLVNLNMLHGSPEPPLCSYWFTGALAMTFSLVSASILTLEYLSFSTSALSPICGIAVGRVANGMGCVKDLSAWKGAPQDSMLFGGWRRAIFQCVQVWKTKPPPCKFLPVPYN